MTDVLAELYDTLQERKHASAQDSYVASLYRDGLDRILKKVGEEATETVIAAKSGDRAALVEVAHAHGAFSLGLDLDQTQGSVAGGRA